MKKTPRSRAAKAKPDQLKMYRGRLLAANARYRKAFELCVEKEKIIKTLQNQHATAKASYTLGLQEAERNVVHMRAEVRNLELANTSLRKELKDLNGARIEESDRRIDAMGNKLTCGAIREIATFLNQWLDHYDAQG